MSRLAHHSSILEERRRDAFGRQRTSEPYTLFDSKLLADKQARFFDEALTGNATSVFDAANAWVHMAVLAGTDSATRQTFMRFNYQPGKSQLIYITVRAPQEANVTKRIGYYDGTDGIYLEITGTSISFNIKKGGTVTESITQSQWNIDRLDGTGTSGETLDLSHVQLMVIDFSWLSVGAVRVGFMLEDGIIYAHTFLHANSANASYMNTPNLPIRLEITSSGGAGTLDQICTTVISEGGSEERGTVFSLDTGVLGTVTTAASGVLTAILGIRLKDGSHGVVQPVMINVSTGANVNVYWALHRNPTVAGTFTYADVDNTAVQKATGAATNTVTTAAGSMIISGFFSNTNQSSGAYTMINKQFLHLGTSIAGVADTFVLSVATSAAAAVSVSMGIQESV